MLFKVRFLTGRGVQPTVRDVVLRVTVSLAIAGSLTVGVGCSAPRARFQQAFQSPWLRGDTRGFFNERAFHGDDLAVLRSRRRAARVAMVPPSRADDGGPVSRVVSPHTEQSATLNPPAPERTSPERALTTPENVVDRRHRIVEFARSLLGGRFRDSSAFVRQVYGDAGVDAVGGPGRPVVGSPVKAIYLFALARNAVHYLPRPTPADVVFFHNTRDVNSDGRFNDWLSQVGIVESIDSDSTISVVTVVRGRVARISMNLRQPDLRRDVASKRVVNTELRRRKPTDSPRLGTLSGQLFAGFGRLVR